MYKKFLVALLLIFAFISCSWAETFTVTNTNAEGSGSLAWAVNSVNSSSGGENSISFSSSIKSLTLPQELAIMKTVYIYGNGVILRAPSNTRIFTVSAGSVVFDSITFTGGNVTADDGGAVKITGPDSTVEFINCTFYNNKSDSFGGAVCVTNGVTTLTHCTVAGNSAENGGLAVRNGELNIFASIVIGNSSSDIYKSNSGTLAGNENIIGTSNYENFGEGNAAGYKLNEVLLTDANGRPLLDDSGVIKLTGTSIALDYIDSGRSYGVDYDELRTPRPQLNYPDAGAYEAMPVAVESVSLYTPPYMQVGTQDLLSIDIYPLDASRNVRDYPPSGISWWVENPNVLAVDDDNNLHAVGIGTSYITATVYGWDSNGREITKNSDSYLITVGSEARRPLSATISLIGDMSLYRGSYTLITPRVTIDMNGIIFEDADYRLNAYSDANHIVTAEIVNGYDVRLSAGDTEGDALITIEARPYPEGDAMSVSFLVSVVREQRIYGGGGSSGGCNSLGCAFILAPVCAYIMNKKRSRK